MVDAPERIWAWPYKGEPYNGNWMVAKFEKGIEYIRADRIEALERQLTEARADVRRLTEEQARIVEINKQHCKTINSYIVDNSRQEDARKAAEAERDCLTADNARHGREEMKLSDAKGESDVYTHPSL